MRRANDRALTGRAAWARWSSEASGREPVTTATTDAWGSRSVAILARSPSRSTPAFGSIFVSPSRKALGEDVGTGPSWLVKLRSRRSRMTAAPIEAATLTPSSYSR